MRKKLVLRRSVAQEKQIARETAGRRTAGSGSTPTQSSKGDVAAPGWLVEAKQTSGAGYRLTLATWRQVYVQAVRQSRHPVMQIDIAGQKLAVIDWALFLDLRAALD